MDRYTLRTRLERIEADIPKLTNTVSAMKATNIETYGKNYEALSLEASLRAERIACSLRNLIFSANLVAKPILLEQAAQVQGITIHHTSQMVEITLPGLMPKRTKRINTTYLTDPLYVSMEHYARLHVLPHFKDCVVCFTHVFDRALSLKRIHDYDNLECKQLLDTVSCFLLTDDGSLYCDAYHTTSLGQSDYTILTIMEKDAFPEWLKPQDKSEKEMSNF